MKIHFIGIGGASLSKLAIIYKSLGYEVSGSDHTQNYTTIELQKLGISVFYSHKAEHVYNSEMVIYSDAIHDDNIEYSTTKELGIPLVSRKKALNLIADMYKKVIAICGCHGKTTTTALLASALNKLNPQMHIGGEINHLGLTKNYFKKVIKASHVGDFFVTEACEFKKNLLALNPNYIVLLNIEPDHLDCYKNLEEIKQTFLEFSQKLEDNKNSILFYNADDPSSYNVASNTNTKKISFGVNNNADYMAKNILLHKNGIEFELWHNNKKIKKINCSLYGKHNAYNILATCTVCEYFKMQYKKLNNYYNYIKKFEGVKRRFEILGEINGNNVIHDYAHHPTEISATIKAAQEHFNKPVVVVFEPHTYTRTKGLWNEFKESLKLANYGYLLDIYSAREEPIDGITSLNLANEIDNFKYVQNYEKCVFELKNVQNSVILVLGAGSIENLAYKLVEKI